MSTPGKGSEPVPGVFLWEITLTPEPFYGEFFNIMIYYLYILDIGNVLIYDVVN